MQVVPFEEELVDDKLDEPELRIIASVNQGRTFVQTRRRTWRCGRSERPIVELLQPVDRERLFALKDLMDLRFDGRNRLHESLLRRLWRLYFPGESYNGRASALWADMGFQGLDPATDFRGAGVFGLHCLVYLASVQKALIADIRTHGRLYPFSGETQYFSMRACVTRFIYFCTCSCGAKPSAHLEISFGARE
jgi:hypothetical protein